MAHRKLLVLSCQTWSSSLSLTPAFGRARPDGSLINVVITDGVISDIGLSAPQAHHLEPDLWKLVVPHPRTMDAHTHFQSVHDASALG
jgi:hypothetical protein